LYQPEEHFVSIGEPTANVGAVAVEELVGVIERVERLELKKAAIAGDIRDVFAEAKGAGFDVKAIREIIKIRKLDAAVHEEQATIVEVYKRALGMASDQDVSEAA
jgi:uncharacterized protein (UPF0335 family)